MEKQTGSKSGKESIKALYCQPAYLTYMQCTSSDRLGWLKHKLESKLLGEERLAKEAFWLPATRGLKKDSDKAITPAVEAVCVPAHLLPPGSPQAKQLCTLTGAELPQAKKKTSCICAHRVTLFVSNYVTLWTVACQLLCQWGSPGKNTGVYWPILVCIPF